MKTRLWILGSLEHKVIPTKATIQKLAAILSDTPSEGVMDFIWDDGLKCQVVEGDVDEVLVPVAKQPDGTILYRLEPKPSQGG